MENNLEGIDTIFFDLDGTLLDMKEEDFKEFYTREIAKYFPEIKKKPFLEYFWTGTNTMFESNDKEKLLLDTFTQSFSKNSGLDEKDVANRFTSFYQGSFTKMRDISKPNYALEVVKMAKSRGIKLILATNPVFPKIAMVERCSWAGIDDPSKCFSCITHAENSTVCKPNPRYFKELLKKVYSIPQKTLMVGNHYLYDLAAKEVGMKTWLIDKNIMGYEHKGKYDVDFHGSLKNLSESIERLPQKYFKF